MSVEKEKKGKLVIPFLYVETMGVNAQPDLHLSSA